MAKVIDCSEMGHDAGMRIRAASDDELVKAMDAHVGKYHPGMSLTREKVLDMAREE